MKVASIGDKVRIREKAKVGRGSDSYIKQTAIGLQLDDYFGPRLSHILAVCCSTYRESGGNGVEGHRCAVLCDVEERDLLVVAAGRNLRAVSRHAH